MISIVCFDLVHAALDTKAGLYWVLGGASVGIAGVCLLNYAIDRHANSHVPKEPDHPKTADCPGSLSTLTTLSNTSARGEKVGLFIAGMVMASAIALHNLPEGMTIGASFVYTDDLLSGPTLLLAWLIGLHNIPEGMAVAVLPDQRRHGRPKAVLCHGRIRHSHHTWRPARLLDWGCRAAWALPQPFLCQRRNAFMLYLEKFSPGRIAFAKARCPLSACLPG